MSRHIDEEKLCEGLKDMAQYQEPYKRSTILGVVSTIENTPTADVVEVVRCKDCKYCRTLKDGGSQCERIDGLLMTKPNDYCSYGKRREKNEG